MCVSYLEGQIQHSNWNHSHDANTHLMLTQLISKESYRHQVSYDINRILLSKILFEIWLVLYRQIQSFFSRDSRLKMLQFPRVNLCFQINSVSTAPFLSNCLAIFSVIYEHGIKTITVGNVNMRFSNFW